MSHRKSWLASVWLGCVPSWVLVRLGMFIPYPCRTQAAATFPGLQAHRDESLGSPPEQAHNVLSAKAGRRQCQWAPCKGGFGPLLGICILLTLREAVIPSQVLRQSPPSPSHIGDLLVGTWGVCVGIRCGWEGKLILSFSLFYIVIKLGLWSLCV